MRAWLNPLLSGILGMTLLTLLLLAVLPFLARRYRQRTVYTLLIICLLGFLIPWRPPVTPKTAVTVKLPAETAHQLQPFRRVTETTVITTDSQIAHVARISETARADASARPAADISLILALIWGAGALSVLSYELVRYSRLNGLLKRWREKPDAATQNLLRQEVQTIGLRKSPALWFAPCIPGPMVTGLIRPAVYLPQGISDAEDLSLILRHELTHLHQGDLPVKWLTLLVCALHWPNPTVWLLRHALNQTCELSCDERVMTGSSLGERTRYSETIIAAIRVGAGTPTMLCTAFQGGLKRMKRRILHIMDTHAKRIGAAAIAVLVCMTVLAGSLLSFSAADEAAGLPPFPEGYDRESEELVEFPTPYQAFASREYTPAYNYSDDPQYPAAFYAPGTVFEITGQKWRSEHIPGVTGDGGMVWLQANVLDGEALQSIWLPETFVTIGQSDISSDAIPKGILKSTESGNYVSLYARITDKTPFSTAESGREAELISWQPGWAQVRFGGRTGYVAADQLTLGEEITARLNPKWISGFDSWRLGYGDYYHQYLAWFGEMENRYGSTDFWSNDLKAMMTDMQRDYGLLQPGDTAFTLPKEGDISAEEAVAIGKRLIGDDGSTDELGIPYYAWQAYFTYTSGKDETPYWMLRAWATHTDMDRQNVRLTRTGELIGINPFRDDPDQHSTYYSIALDVLYGEDETVWPASVRTAYDPEHCPPLQEGWITEEDAKAIALTAIENHLGAEKLAKVQADFSVCASYYNYGKFDENDLEDRIFWTVRYVNTAPGDAEEIQVHINMDGSLRGEPIDDYYGDIDFTPGGNG